MSRKKKILAIAGVACIIVASLSVIYVAASPAWTIDDLINWMEVVGSKKIKKTLRVTREIREKMGQGLVGENTEASITLDGVHMQIMVSVLPSEVRDNPKKITLYIDLSDMGAGDTVNVWLAYDADYDEKVASYPHRDAPEDALTGSVYDFTWNGDQAYDVKLVFKQLPISEYFIVIIKGTNGLVVPYHWILEEV